MMLSVNFNFIKFNNYNQISFGQRTSPEKKEQIIEKYKQGYTQYEVADMLDCTQKVVFDALKEREDKQEIKDIHKKNALRKNYNVDQVIDMYKAGYTQKNLIKAYRCSGTTLSAILNIDGNLKELKKERKKNKIVNQQEIVNLYKKGYKIQQIKDICNCFHSDIMLVLKERDDFQQLQEERRRNSQKKIFDSNQRQSIIELYKQGRTTRQIADEIGCSYTLVSNVINGRQDVKEIKYEHKMSRIHPKDASFDDNQRQEIIDLYKKGYSSSQLAEMYKCDADIIHKIMKNQQNYSEIKAQHIINTRKVDYTTVLNLYLQGYTQKEIAKLLNCGQNTVSKVILRQENYEEVKKEHKLNKAILQKYSSVQQ